MTRLNFAIAGAQRSATTSLKAAMSEHPDIGFLSNQREQLSYRGEYIGFPFTSPFGSRSLLGVEDGGAAYDAISEHAGNTRHVGTKWPYFMIFPHIACNLRQHLPDLRLIFILRNPTECLWSSFRKQYEGEDVVADFRAYVEEGLAAIEGTTHTDKRSRWNGMLFADDSAALALDRGCYYPQLMNFVVLFGWSRIRVIDYKAFAREPDTTVNAVFEWMGLRPLERLQSTGKRHNAVAEHTSAEVASTEIDPETRKRLMEFYAPSNRRLCQLLGWDLDAWTAA